MSFESQYSELATQLINAGQFIDSKGWVPATSGNFSARVDDNRIAITESGKHKGRLTIDDIMLVDLNGHSLDGKKPSAETQLHTMLYQRYSGVNAVLHPHSLNATLAARFFTDAMVLENYELLKALPGIESHEERITIPIFPNDQDISRLSGKVANYLDSEGDIHAYIIAGHGFYTWGDNVAATLRHLEALEFLFECELRMHGVGK